MRVAHVSFSDAAGGAGRAAHRIHTALRREGVDSSMLVAKKSSDDWSVTTPGDSLFKLGTLVRPQIAGLLMKVARAPASLAGARSPSLLNSRWPRCIERQRVDVINLHWLCAEMMSVEDVGRLRAPVVWTFHDMWPFCGTEHYAPEEDRWASGYRDPATGGRFDIDRWLWKRKRRAWKRAMTIVAPSRWLAQCAKRSPLLADWPVVTVPNPIDLEEWSPIDKRLARNLLGLRTEARLIAFGAMGATPQPYKGFDLLLDSLAHLQSSPVPVEAIVFGQSRPKTPARLPIPVHYVGHLGDNLSLRVLYSAADAVVLPSRMDNLPNVAVEALACGTPLVAFNTCGLPDLVEHRVTGWLAEAFSTEDLARGIAWVLADECRHVELCRAARGLAQERFSYGAVARQYEAVYRQAMSSS